METPRAIHIHSNIIMKCFIIPVFMLKNFSSSVVLKSHGPEKQSPLECYDGKSTLINMSPATQQVLIM